jgi:chromosome segregation protein
VQLHERAQAESKSAERRIEALQQEIADELRIPPTELRPSEQEPPSETDIKRLRSRAMQYADADPSVVEEARELAERHSYLSKHVEDLRSAAETLRAMMEVADVEMRAQFEVAFDAVSEEFSRVFEVMLRGGHARLEQLDGGGVEVIAQLPGKRSRSSAAFSGGERSLIASSLLFGVLKMRPAPFCVLDEVDAALDEGNVDRYLVALRDISQKTQAVVVTHNRATMAAADVLYGLTMDTEGASDVLSLRLDAQAAG